MQQIKELASKKYSYLPFVESLFKGRSGATNDLYGVISAIDTSNIRKASKSLDDYMKKYSPDQSQDKANEAGGSRIIKK